MSVKLLQDRMLAEAMARDRGARVGLVALRDRGWPRGLESRHRRHRGRVGSSASLSAPGDRRQASSNGQGRGFGARPARFAPARYVDATQSDVLGSLRRSPSRCWAQRSRIERLVGAACSASKRLASSLSDPATAAKPTVRDANVRSGSSPETTPRGVRRLISSLLEPCGAGNESRRSIWRSRASVLSARQVSGWALEAGARTRGWRRLGAFGISLRRASQFADREDQCLG